MQSPKHASCCTVITTLLYIGENLRIASLVCQYQSAEAYYLKYIHYVINILHNYVYTSHIIIHTYVYVYSKANYTQNVISKPRFKGFPEER